MTEEFSQTLIYDRDPEACVKRLRSLDLTAVIAGCEPAVPLADHLSELLGLPSNKKATSSLRRNKALMQKALKSKGLRYIQGLETEIVEEAVKWSTGRDKVIVKPLDSAGTDGVTLCRNEIEIYEAFKQNLGKINEVGLLNRTLLVQEFIEGEEYVVNAVTCDGESKVTQVWKYHKGYSGHGDLTYDYDRLMEVEGDEKIETLVDYALLAADALGIEWGAVHCEVKVDEQGPVFIECAARLCGAENTKLNRKAIGYGQPELVAKAYLDPDSFRSYPRIYKRRMEAQNVYLICRQRGVVSSYDKLSKLYELPSFVDCVIKVGVGDRVQRTRDIPSCPGYVFMVSKTWKQLELDRKAIRSLEPQLFHLT